MKKSILIIILSLGYLLSNAQSGSLFYYAFDDKIYLNPVTNKFSVEFINSVDESVFDANNLDHTKVSQKLYEVEGDLIEIQNAGQGIYNLNQVYTTDDGLKMHMKNSIILQWKEGVSESQRNNYITQYGLTETKSTRLYNIYQVTNPLPISQIIYEAGEVRYCHPEFLAEVVKHEHIPNDEYFGQQFYLHNTGQECNDGHFGTADADIDAPEAWDITFGSSDIIVAIVDEGVTDDHPDLPSDRQLRLDGSNFNPDDGLADDNPSPHGHGNHGNSCAGIVAAEMDNNEGVVGIAPECIIMPVKIPFGSYPAQTYADAITFAADNGANIISNSWGYSTSDPNFQPVIVTAIEDAIAQGSIVLFSAGNTANRVSGNNGYVGFPANANIPQLITVGASDRNDDQANYSPTDSDSEVEICAPSHTAYNSQITGEAFNVWTIDIPGDDGYNTWHATWSAPLPAVGEELPDFGTNNLSYTGRMGGTSAATPEVAGVIALMLSVNPCLSIDQVLDILYNTAEKVGGYDYAWNNDQLGHSQELGYGRVNAFFAVQAAQQIMVADVDLYTKDVPADFGIEPDDAAEFLWVSDDIWVRNQQDGFDNQVHENPEYSTTDPVYVYVRVRNNGCNPTLGTEELNLYWAKAATALSWPDYWDGSITSPALMGDQVDVQTLNTIDAGGTTIVEFEWYPPNPADYDGINDQPWHFCLLTRIVATNDPMNDELWTGTWNLGHNVRHNNNIAWKNLSVVDILPGIVGGGWNDDKLVGATVAIGNASSETGTFNLEFKVPKDLVGYPITKAAEVRITLDDLTWQKWIEGGQEGTNVRISREDRNQLIIEAPEARLENLSYQAHERSLINLSFNFLTKELTGKTAFDYYVVQTNTSTGEVLGGEKYHITIPSRESFTANAGDDKEISKDEVVALSANEISEDAIYNWYDPSGNLIHTGKDLTITPEMTKTYKLEVIAESDGFKDYDEIEVKVKLAEIENIFPNPASNLVTIQYDAQNVSSAYLMISMPYSGSTDNFVLDITQGEITIDVSAYQTGVYGLILVADGQMVDQKGLIIE